MPARPVLLGDHRPAARDEPRLHPVEAGAEFHPQADSGQPLLAGTAPPAAGDDPTDHGLAPLAAVGGIPAGHRRAHDEGVVLPQGDAGVVDDPRH